jgi:hypothetical protein
VNRELPSTAIGAGPLGGLPGSNVTSAPLASTAVHWPAVGHDTPVSTRPGSTGWTPPPAKVLGLIEISLPTASTATHSEFDAHDSAVGVFFGSIVVVEFVAGPNTTSDPPESTTTQFEVEAWQTIATGVTLEFGFPSTVVSPVFCGFVGSNPTPSAPAV